MLHTSRSPRTANAGRRRSILLLALALAAAACGSSETSAAEDDTVEAVESAEQAADGEPETDGDFVGSAEQGEELRDDLTSGLGEEEQAELDAGISSIDGETRFGIIADQMSTPPAEISIVGNEVRFRFDSGTVEEDPLFDCILIGVLAEEGEMIVVEYPDGETDC